MHATTPFYSSATVFHCCTPFHTLPHPNMFLKSGRASCSFYLHALSLRCVLNMLLLSQNHYYEQLQTQAYPSGYYSLTILIHNYAYIVQHNKITGYTQCNEFLSDGMQQSNSSGQHDPFITQFKQILWKVRGCFLACYAAKHILIA